VIVFGAEVNWQFGERRRAVAEGEEAAGLA
jgi:hypothetical protein